MELCCVDSSDPTLGNSLFVAVKLLKTANNDEYKYSGHISHIFSNNFIEIPQLVQKIWRFFSSILAIFINFSDFLTLPCYKKTNDVSI